MTGGNKTKIHTTSSALPVNRGPAWKNPLWLPWHRQYR